MDTSIVLQFCPQILKSQNLKLNAEKDHQTLHDI